MGELKRAAGENAGVYQITQGTLALNGNYNLTYANASLTINKAAQVITIVPLSVKTYGDADFAVSATSNNNNVPITYTSSNPLVATVTGNTIHIKKAGTTIITVSQTGDANYAAAPDVQLALTINKALLTVTTANKIRAYGVNNPEFTLTYNGFMNGDTQNSLTTPAIAVTNAIISSDPGSYPITVAGASSPNYIFNYVSGTLTVTPLTNANLINIMTSTGTLTPLFNSNNVSYQLNLPYNIDQLSLIPTFDPTATARINDLLTGNGSTSIAIPIATGNNTIAIVVTAQDKITNKTYIINVYKAVPPLSVEATNILTPNGDGKNDAWIVKDIQLYPNNTVSIYDVSGRMVYNKYNYNNDWDGSLHGLTPAKGVYFYLIDLGTGVRQIKGFITIL